MLKKPQIASYVRAITLGGGYRNPNFVVKDDAEHREPVDEALEMAVKAASNCEEEERDWLENLRHDDEYAAIALLLPALVRLEKLDLMVRIDSLYLDTMLQRASVRHKPFDTRPAFDALTEVTYSSWEHNDLIVLARFFKLPSVRKIYSLVLGRDKADEDQANPNFGFPRAWVFITLGSVSLPNFNNTELHRALEPARSTLETLCITYAADEAYFNHDDDLSAMASFEYFKALKHIKVAMLFFFGNEPDDDGEESFSKDQTKSCKARNQLVNLLPSTIETLHFTHCERTLKRLRLALERLLEQKEQRVPRLQRITTEADYNSKNKSTFEGLDPHAIAVGVFVCKLDTSEIKHSNVERSWPRGDI
ncbi:hypothetical protein MMC08_007456 [Hypocenomyce scalaris]|nr:hypothetical protein [Hypocenomyce scalaris]